MDTLGVIILGVFSIVSFICAFIYEMKYKNTLEYKMLSRGPLHVYEVVRDINYVITKSVDSSGIDGTLTTHKVFYLMTVLASAAEDYASTKTNQQFLPMRISRPGLEVVIRTNNF